MGEVGQLVFRFYDDSDMLQEIYCDTIQSVSDEISASASVTPIVTYDAENAFAFDISANETIHIPFIRKNPFGVTYTQGDETGNSELPAGTPASKGWSNRKWQEEFTKFINRWQTRSDGCTMSYIPPGSVFSNGEWQDTEYQHAINNLNVYIRSLSFNNSINSYETVTGTISLQMGSMTANALKPATAGTEVEGYNDPIDCDGMTVTMTTPDGAAEYLLYSKALDVNCINSYTLKGGSEQPFEYLTMQLSKKRMSTVAPMLVDNIFAGRNRITINAIGTGEFIVTKCSTSGQNYKIVAYSKYELYRSYSLDDNVPFGQTGSNPLNVIKAMLINALGPAENPLSFPEEKIVFAVKTSYNSWNRTNQKYFNGGTSAWYIMSVCALMLSAKIWFSDDYAYIIDTSLTADDIASSSVTKSGHFTNTANYRQLSLLEIPRIYLNLNTPYPINITETEEAFTTAVCDSISLGDEGAETIHNNVNVRIDIANDHRDNNDLAANGRQKGLIWTGLTREQTDDGSTQYWYVTDLSDLPEVEQSQKRYGKKDVNYTIKEIDDVDAYNIAARVAEANCDSEQSIGFKLKEMHIEPDPNDDNRIKRSWQKYFPPLVRTDTIYDYSNDLIDSNRCNFRYNEVSAIGGWSALADPTPYKVQKDAKVTITAAWRSLVLAYEYRGVEDPVKVYDLDGNELSNPQYTVTGGYTAGGYTVNSIELTITQSCYVKIKKIDIAIGQTSSYTDLATLTFIVDNAIMMPNKLFLSTYEHMFPEGITKYWFGIIKPTDVSQNSSEISNALNNG